MKTVETKTDKPLTITKRPGNFTKFSTYSLSNTEENDGAFPEGIGINMILAAMCSLSGGNEIKYGFDEKQKTSPVINTVLKKVVGFNGGYILTPYFTANGVLMFLYTWVVKERKIRKQLDFSFTARHIALSESTILCLPKL